MADDRTMSQLPPPETGVRPDGDPPSALSPRARGLIAVTAIVVSAIVFVSAVALIYYKGLTVEVPTSQIVVEGVEELDGAVISLDGTGLRQTLQSTLSRESDFLVKFHVAAGVYRVVVTHELGTVTEEIMLQDNRMVFVPLKKYYPSLDIETQDDAPPRRTSAYEAGSSRFP